MCIGNNVHIIILCVYTSLYNVAYHYSEMHEIGPHLLSVCTAEKSVLMTWVVWW